MIFINHIYTENSHSGLKRLPDEYVDCCVTSPPYYGLRDYGTATWEGGDQRCKHSIRKEAGFEKWKQSTNRGNAKNLPKGICPKCGAIRIDNQIGLEDTPEEYIKQLVEIFMEIYRVLKPGGTLWINIGDSYWGGKGYSGSSAGTYQYERRKEGKSINHEYSNFGGRGTIRPTDRKHEFIKRKDLIGIPWMLAFALRNAGWYLRQDIIWYKPNPMPESVRDRCTKSHEYIFLLTKSDHYYFNQLKEPQSKNTNLRYSKDVEIGKKPVLELKINSKEANRPGYKEYRKYTPKTILEGGRNKRSVWCVPTQGFKEGHFATFPEQLIKDCILGGWPPDGIVLDPFMGSGTTAIVTRKLNRNYIGFELNPAYTDIANKRLVNELGLFQ
ncbi:Modification methylase MboII [termite gut metagenome]|uniref:site-specific DNA-methyltransferase (cytosine-N(4)-specific) n=1 Tax=termite gut metagenome TaxID=433724 RepID=A0A5J4S215_9ZZZZ